MSHTTNDYWTEDDNDCDWDTQPKWGSGKNDDKEEILRELKDKAIPEIIKQKATEMFYEYYSDKTRRGNKRLSRILGCIFEAYRECDQVKNIYELARLINLPEKYVGSSLKELRIKQVTVSQKDGKPLPQTIRRYATPLDGIPEIFDSIGILGDISFIEQLYDRVRHRSDTLHRSKPESVAYALVCYYLTQSSDSKIDLSKIFKIFQARDKAPCLMTIKKLVEEISLLENHSS